GGGSGEDRERGGLGTTAKERDWADGTRASNGLATRSSRRSRIIERHRNASRVDTEHRISARGCRRNCGGGDDSTRNGGSQRADRNHRCGGSDSANVDEGRGHLQNPRRSDFPPAAPIRDPTNAPQQRSHRRSHREQQR
ncbi:unnamed protein product, partial [Mycena citricolor]